jgi:hypothetical protein
VREVYVLPHPVADTKHAHMLRFTLIESAALVNVAILVVASGIHNSSSTSGGDSSHDGMTVLTAVSIMPNSSTALVQKCIACRCCSVQQLFVFKAQ